MKKLMIVAVAAMVGIAAQAASIAWDNGDGDLFGYATGGAADGYAIYFFDTAAMSLTQANEYLVSGDVATLIAAGQEGYAADGGWVEGEATGFTAGTTVTAYLIAFNAGDAASATFAYISDTAEIAMPTSGMAGGNSWDLSGSADSSAWTPVAGPEPTSGLLLLLGLSGLALRRKRA